MSRPASETCSPFEELTDRPWHMHWTGDAVRDLVPETVVMRTSGTTGPSQEWPRTRDQLWAEAELLADLLRPYRPEAVVSFAPPRHLFGALVSVLVPACLGVPVWYRPGFFGSLPPVADRRVVVMAVPWIFQLLLQHLDWMRSVADLTVLHSTALLPATAGDFLATAEHARIVEVFGSTETGGVAHRSWRGGNPLWHLFDDVTLDSADDGPLVVRSPRLARDLASWQMDDFVELVGDRRFRFTGRRGRLVKVNGRRLNLDELEVALRAVVDCADLALVPGADAMTGEHIDLLIVPVAGVRPDLTPVHDVVGLRPRSVRVVDRIDRTETGKLRRAVP